MADKLPDLPPGLKDLELPTGVSNRYLKVLVYGGYKTGKSFFLSHFPPPMLGIDCGEGGIASFMPKGDPRYKCIQVTNPDQYEVAVRYAIKHEDQFESVVVDPITALWTDHMDYWNDKLGHDIQGGEWRLVKGPWKEWLRKLMRANFHVGYSAWVKENEYIQSVEAPGVQGKLVINPVQLPQIERTVGYMLDLIFQTEVERDRLGRPSKKHEVIFYGGRKPSSVSPKELHVGKTWKFDARADPPINVWDTIIGPFLKDYQQNGGEHIGIDPEAAAKIAGEVEKTAENMIVGELIEKIDSFTSATALRSAVSNEIRPMALKLKRNAQKLVKEKLEAKEKELTDALA